MLLIVSGRLDLDNGIHRLSMETPEALLLVEPNTCADLAKAPGGAEQRFRSVFLTFSAELLDAFYRSYPAARTSCPPVTAFRRVALDKDLAASLRHVVESVADTSISDERLRYRLLDLLVALAERGHLFGPVDQTSTSARLRAMIGEAPARRWTAQAVGKELAMSVATLRRRLANEGARYEDVLVDVRMHHALMLVQTTAWSITRVAEACGYQSRARFTQRFHERFGYLPSAVR